MEKICNYLGRGAGRSFPQGLICGSKAACGEQEEDEHPHPAGGPCQQWADQKHCLPFSHRAQTTGPGRSRGPVTSVPQLLGLSQGLGGRVGPVVPSTRVVRLCVCLFAWGGRDSNVEPPPGWACPVLTPSLCFMALRGGVIPSREQ